MAKKGKKNTPTLEKMPLIHPHAAGGLDQGIGHLSSMNPQKNERFIPSRG